jgi:hypothetical protein
MCRFLVLRMGRRNTHKRAATDRFIGFMDVMRRIRGQVTRKDAEMRKGPLNRDARPKGIQKSSEVCAMISLSRRLPRSAQSESTGEAA